jgi:ATP-dependent Clp protease ATP-binding subunit ClpA
MSIQPDTYTEKLAQQLAAKVVGQDAAIEQVVNAIVRWRAGLAGIDRPVAAFLMMGQTGCGKTLLAESLTEVMHGDARMMIKIHCAEYKHSHECARLIGAPPGYIGHKETQPRLSSRRIQEAQTKNCPLVIILLDEIEKAHPDFWDIFLGILDKGELHLGDGGSTDLRQSIILMSSNVGAREASQSAGFLIDRKKTAASAAKKLFSPEFRNRLTTEIVFNTLSAEQLRAIADLELQRSAARVLTAKGVAVEFQKDVTDLILKDLDQDFGARPIRRAIENLIELPLAKHLIDTQLMPGDTVEIEVKNGEIKIFRQRPAKAAKGSA